MKINISTPLGNYILTEENNKLTSFQPGKKLTQESRSPLLKKASRQIQQYFLGKRTKFSLPLNPQGTKFQRQVWQALATIPFGQTRSYKDIARQILNPRAIRAIGGANGKNPLPIIIPCHRVIRENGELGGYTGGLAKKKRLLKLEGLL